MRAVRLCNPLWKRSMAYAAAARHSPSVQADRASSDTARSQVGYKASSSKKTSPSPDPVPRTSIPEEEAYVLTFLTGKAHHQRMTQLRNKYFPKHLNKLAAHLTLFHALPGSRLDSDIIPVIEQVVRTTSPFSITASKPFQLGKRGIAIAVLPKQGGARAKEVRDELQAPWKKQGFLSQQDAGKTGRSFPHYTIMNKVEDEAEVRKALDELERDFSPDQDTVVGLALYRYDKGRWRWVMNFDFKRTENT